MILNPIIVSGGTKLPELSDPGTAADLLAPKQLIDADGNVLTGTMPTVAQATPSISVSSSGLITASATQSAGYVEAGTTSATKQLTTQAAATITPGTSAKTAVAAGRYTTGAVTVAGDTNLAASNIKSGVSIFGVNGTMQTQTIGLRSITASMCTFSGTQFAVTLTINTGLTSLTLAKLVDFYLVFTYNTIYQSGCSGNLGGVIESNGTYHTVTGSTNSTVLNDGVGGSLTRIDSISNGIITMDYIGVCLQGSTPGAITLSK